MKAKLTLSQICKYYFYTELFLYAYKIKTVIKQKLLIHMPIQLQKFNHSASTGTWGHDCENINFVNGISLTSFQTVNNVYIIKYEQIKIQLKPHIDKVKQEVLHVFIEQADRHFLKTIIFYKLSKKYIFMIYLQQHRKNKL